MNQNRSDEVGHVSLGLRLNTDSVSKQMKSATAGIEKMAKKAGIAIASAFGVKKILDFGKECLSLGSDLTEVQNVVDTSFRTMSDDINEFAKNARKQFGISEIMAKRYSGTVGAMAKAFGFAEKQSADMAKSIAGMAGDVASFYNLEQDAAFTKLKSIFTGETESLKELGIVMTQSALDQYALANGFKKTTKDMTEQEKVALRYKFVMSQLSDVSGDFAKTAGGSWANQLRVFGLQIDSIKAAIGQGLINVFLPLIKMANAAIERIGVLAEKFRDLSASIFGDAGGGGSGAGAIAADLASAASNATDLSGAADAAGESIANAAKEAAGLMGFDAINKLQDSSDSNGASSGAAGDAFDIAGLTAADAAVSSVERHMNGLLNAAKKVTGMFSKGFKIGFGDSVGKFEEIKKNAKSLKDSLLNISSDGKVKKSFNGMLASMLLSVGLTIGSFGSIGTTAIDNLTAGAAISIERDTPAIQENIASIFDATGRIAEQKGKYAAAADDIFSVFSGDTAKQCTSDIISIFDAGFLGALDIGTQFAADIETLITQPVIDNVDGIKLAIENTLAPISTVLGTIRQGFEDTAEKAREVYDAHIGPMLESFAGGISELATSLLDSYNTNIAPVLQNLADQFEGVWAEHIQPALDAFLELTGSVSDDVTQIWEETLQPFTNWIIQTLGPVVAPVIEELGGKALTAFGDMADSVKETFENLEEFFGNITENLPTADELIEKVTSICNWFKENSANIEATAIILAGFTASVIAHNIASNAAAITLSVVSAATGIYNTVTAAAATVTGTFSAALSFLTSPITLVIMSIAAATAAGVLLYKNWDTISAKAKKIWSSIKENISTAIGGIQGTFNKFKTFMSDFWDNIKSKFTDIGSKIGESVSGAFKAVVNSVFDNIENKVNGFIKMINGAIGIINNIPGVNIGTIDPVSIPRLAQGGYVKANTPRLAMIGDNKTQGEIVAPENKLRQMAREAAEGGGSMSEVIELLRQIIAILLAIDPVEIDPESIRKYMIRKTNQNTKATGRCELIY